jgi:broad specificity phosphatase PhoE
VTLILVRHGESEGNAAGIVQGWLDVPLSARGRAQAAATARRLAEEPVAAVYSSDLTRALQTAAPIAEAHALAVTPVPALREYRYGEAQGLSWPEVAARWPSSGRVWGAGHIPGEEGADAFRARVAEAFDALAARHRDDVAVVASHGGTMGQILAHLMALPVGAYVHSSTPNCALTTIGAGRDAPVLVALNDLCHLAEVTVAD